MKLYRTKYWFCPKCGDIVSNITWKIGIKNEDYLHLKCSRCGYYWNEDCLDRKGKK